MPVLNYKSVRWAMVGIMLTFLLIHGARADDFELATDERIEIEQSITVDGLPTGSAPLASPAGEGRIYFNSTDNEFKVSEDGSSYRNLVGGDFKDGGDSEGNGRTLGNNDAFDLDIETNNTSRIKIQSGGNVGIGVSAPNQRLEVNGAIKSVEFDNTTAAVINVDWATGNQQTVSLNQAGHTVTFANVFPGQIFRLVVCQDGTGSRTITTWPSNVRFNNGVTAPTLSTAGNACDVFSFIATDAAGIPASMVILGTIVRGFNVL